MIAWKKRSELGHGITKRDRRLYQFEKKCIETNLIHVAISQYNQFH